MPSRWSSGGPIPRFFHVEIVAVGKTAVEFAVQGYTAVMPTIVRISDGPYTWPIEMAPLEEVANQEKPLPHAFISADGFSS
jgi:ATP-dependent phosphofructokinase / diphosphate-dependent phosphofructokinase